jgi:hypothetical protein
MTPEGSHDGPTKRKLRRPCRHARKHIAQVVNAEVKGG